MFNLVIMFELIVTGRTKRLGIQSKVTQRLGTKVRVHMCWHRTAARGPTLPTGGFDKVSGCMVTEELLAGNTGMRVESVGGRERERQQEIRGAGS